MGDLRQHFSRAEFACACCHRLDVIDDRLLDVLQRARTAKGRPLRIVSGYRCCRHNATVGGIRYSQHLYGRAADVPRGYASVREWESFGAIGIGVRDGQVIHVDVEPGRPAYTFRE